MSLSEYRQRKMTSKDGGDKDLDNSHHQLNDSSTSDCSDANKSNLSVEEVMVSRALSIPVAASATTAAVTPVASLPTLIEYPLPNKLTEKKRLEDGEVLSSSDAEPAEENNDDAG